MERIWKAMEYMGWNLREEPNGFDEVLDLHLKEMEKRLGVHNDNKIENEETWYLQFMTDFAQAVKDVMYTLDNEKLINESQIFVKLLGTQVETVDRDKLIENLIDLYFFENEEERPYDVKNYAYCLYIARDADTIKWYYEKLMNVLKEIEEE